MNSIDMSFNLSHDELPESHSVIARHKQGMQRRQLAVVSFNLSSNQLRMPIKQYDTQSHIAMDSEKSGPDMSFNLSNELPESHSVIARHKLGMQRRQLAIVSFNLSSNQLRMPIKQYDTQSHIAMDSEKSGPDMSFNLSSIVAPTGHPLDQQNERYAARLSLQREF
ncbi:hypothetical protein KW429_11365 [Vibrio fluvialis]|nr:hypothetical protein [Vibrio fluvialis]